MGMGGGRDGRGGWMGRKGKMVRTKFLSGKKEYQCIESRTPQEPSAAMQVNFVCRLNFFT